MSLILALAPKRYNYLSKSAATIYNVWFLQQNPQNTPAKSTNVDAIDCFTNDLVIRKALKWELYQERLVDTQRNKNNEMISHPFQEKAKRLLTEISKLRSVEMCIQMQPLNQYHIDHLVMSALFDKEDSSNFYAIMDQCIEFNKIPSEPVVLSVLEYLSQIGNLLYLQKFTALLFSANPTGLNDRKYDRYKAQCLWKQGNSVAALTVLRDTYKSIMDNKMEVPIDSIREVYRIIIEETVDKRSEAVLIAVINEAKYLHKMYGEYPVLAHIWRNCFLSTWFSNQQMAVEIFETYPEIRKIVGNRISITTYNLLQDHNSDAVHRLIELLLKYDMKAECKICLSFLFEYQYWRRDLRACSAIIRSSLDLDMPLSDIQNQKLLTLLLGTRMDIIPNKVSLGAQERFKLQF